MFTGLVERTGTVVSLLQNAAITQLTIDAGMTFDTSIGDSVSVNGCCLTVTKNIAPLLSFDLSSETLKRTSLGDVAAGSEVNLERAMKLGDRLGGHLVSGHIDGLGRVEKVLRLADGWDVRVALPPELRRYVIAKGSVCLDGVSLTINTVEDRDGATVIGMMLIPATVNKTALKHLAMGQRIAVEVDQIGKFVERLTQPFG